MGELRAGYRLGVASVRHGFRFLALALILPCLFSGHFPRCANGQLTSAKQRELLIRGFTDIPRYLSIDGVGAVLVAPNIVLVLDCYTFGFRLYRQQWNISALEWSFNNVPIGLIESRRLQLRNNGIQLIINSTTLESGAEDSTDGLYSCRACAFDGRCQRTNTRITIFAPPIIDIDCSGVPDFLEPVTGLLSFTAGCDLCLEVGQEIQTLNVGCLPSGFLSRQPVTCNFQIGTEPVTPIPGRLTSAFGTLTFTNLINPPLSPELNLLQTYTCNCSNDDGFVLASTTIGSCFVLPQILKGTPIRPFDGEFVDQGDKRIIIGSNNSIQVGFDFEIECRILRGIPPPTISWFLNGVELSGENTSYLIVNTDDPNAASGRYTCVATNRVGNDSASSNLRYGIEIVQPPTITEAPKLPKPDINVVGTIREQVGANVFVIIGERFELTCNITQPVLPEVMYSWFKDGRAVNGSAENEQIFVMDNTTRRAFGLYCCKAVNIGGLSQACSRVIPLESGPILRTQPSSPLPRLPEQVTIAQTTVSIGGSLWTSDQGFGVITCEVILSNPPISSIEWFVDDPPVIIDENTVGVLFDRINITTDLGAMISHLVIRPTLSGDRANFTCLATSPAGTDRASSEYGVIVPPILAAGKPSAVPLTVAPVMVTEVVGSTVHAVQNQSITLECVLVNGTGLPRDTVEFNWYRFSTPLQNDSRISIQSTSSGSVLTIQNASREDSGLFRCEAQNPAGFNAVSSDVFVYSVPTIDVGNDTIIGPALPQGKIGNTFIVVKGSRVFINCDILDGGGFPPQPEMNLPATILWFLDGEPVDPSLFSDDHDNQLCFNAVDFDSGGNITCTAISRIRENGEFLQDSASSIVTVVSMPSFDANFSAVVAQPGERTIIADTQFTRYFVTRGTNLRVLCGVVSTPAANFTWRRYNETESEMEITPSGRLAISAVEGGSQLSIDSFSSGDVGVYKCTGTNIAGSVELSFRVDVCPEVQNCSGSENFTIQASPHPDTRDNCTFCAYYYKGSYGPCDRTCHDGIRTRRIECRVEHRIIDIPLCSEFSQPPSETDTCRSIFPGRPCSVLEPRWVVGQWGKCTRTCGRGYQFRMVKCYLEDTHSFVSASRCTDFRPINWRSCNQRSCGCTDVDLNCSQINTRLCLHEHVRISCCITCLTLAPNTFPSHHH